jgi:hypothetical protein
VYVTEELFGDQLGRALRLLLEPPPPPMLPALRGGEYAE